MMTQDKPAPEAKPAPVRLVSLDAMRGFVMFLLLGGGEIGHAGFLSALFAAIDQPWAQTLYHQLQYSSWGDAIHVKDLIRPLFIFVVGVAMPYSFGKRLSRDDSKRALYGHVLKRAALLIFLGMIAGGRLLALDRSKFYLVNNVLQEIAVGYLVAAVVLLSFRDHDDRHAVLARSTAVQRLRRPSGR